MTRSLPLVSVVTPCLNAGPRLLRCLQSVAAQTYPGVEHIVVDGGSTDGSIEVLKQSGVRYISEPDAGQSHALNKGFAMSKGELLTWLNADDCLMQDAVATAVSELRDPRAPALIYGRAEIHYADGRTATAGPKRRLKENGFDLGNRLVQPATFFTRAALRRVGNLDESLHLVMDLDLWVRLVQLPVEHIFIPKILALFEVHHDSKTGSLPPARFSVEEARSFVKNERVEAAELSLARAAALEALIGHRVTRDEALRKAGHFAELGLNIDSRISVNRVQQSVLPEAGFAELEAGGSGLYALRHIVSKDAWRARLARKRSAHLLLRAIQRVVPRL